MSLALDGLSRLNPGKLAAPLLVPGLIVAAIVLGGASQRNEWQVASLQLICALALIWLVWSKSFEPLPETAKPALWLIAGYFVLLAVQLIPLPPDIWTRLPWRQEVRRGFEVFGGPLPWLPLSLAPEQTLDAGLSLLLPLAVFIAALKSRWRSAFGSLTYLLPLIATASLVLGVLQVFSGEETSLYLYEVTNRGSPVGLYSNVNHHASFLLLALPFVAAMVGRLRQRKFSGEGVIERSMLAATLSVSLIAGVMICGSIAGYVLLGPTLLACFFVARGRGAKSVGSGTIVALVLGLVTLAVAMSTSPFVLGSNIGSALNSGPMSRIDIWPKALAALRTYWQTGAGVGSFELVYPLFEDPAKVTSTYANHAHNDWIEFALETGIAGCVLLGAFLVWFAARCARVWAQPNSEESRLARAASVACLIIMFHSLVDYPLRTMATSSMFALCLAVMLGERRSARATESKNIAI